MASHKREGLRVRLQPQSQKKEKESKAEYMRVYRQNLKVHDPEHYEELRLKKNQQNRQYRQHKKSEDEENKLREGARLRMQKMRARRKAELLADSINAPSTPAPAQRKTRSVAGKDAAAVAAQRAKWAEEKRCERAKWSAQKWRRNREKNLRNYYRQKSLQQKSVSTETDSVDHADQPAPVPPTTLPHATCQVNNENSPSTETCSSTSSSSKQSEQSVGKSPCQSKEALTKARYRAKQLLQKCGMSLALVNKVLSGKKTSTASPESKKIKNCCHWKTGKSEKQ